MVQIYYCIIKKILENKWIIPGKDLETTYQENLLCLQDAFQED